MCPAQSLECRDAKHGGAGVGVEAQLPITSSTSRLTFIQLEDATSVTFGNCADAFRYLRRLVVERTACGAWARKAFREDSKNPWLVDRG